MPGFKSSREVKGKFKLEQAQIKEVSLSWAKRMKASERSCGAEVEGSVHSR